MLGENNYTLDIRPTFIEELDATVRYIEQELQNPMAADKLIEQTYAAIDERLFAPESFEPCYRPPDIKQSYYRILREEGVQPFLREDLSQEVLS